MTAIAYETDPALSFWPTPPEVAQDLVYLAMDPWTVQADSVRVLEPSAGTGHLAAAIRAQLPTAHITCVEPHSGRTAKLRAATGLADQLIESTLEDYLASVALAAMNETWQPFDLVIMNPPFTLPGRPEAWAEHILALYNAPNLVAPWGSISAITPRIVMTGKSPLVRRVRELADVTHECGRGAFTPAGAQVSTAFTLIGMPIPDVKDSQ